MNGGQDITGNQTVTGDSTINGHQTITGGMEVSGGQIVNDGQVVNGNQVVNGSSYIAGNQIVQGNVTADTFIGNDAILGGQSVLGRFSSLDANITEVGAGAAALAALDYLPFDPDDKLNFAVGSGTYKDKTAMALGFKYYPNEDISLNMGTTIGYNDNMWNIGVSFRFGPHTKRANRLTPEQEQALVQTVIVLAEKVKALEAAQTPPTQPDQTPPAKPDESDEPIFPATSSNNS